MHQQPRKNCNTELDQLAQLRGCTSGHRLLSAGYDLVDGKACMRLIELELWCLGIASASLGPMRGVLLHHKCVALLVS